ncbi:MAG: nicotinamide mononucleotide transporter [Vicingus serpentipes]|nr:nicotinamide mononucleotide transporter [Vicingus serpentipes]
MIWASNHIDLLLEIIAVILGIIYVFLAAKNKISCWIYGILGSLLSIILFVFYAKLYAEAMLYLFYVAAGIYGWVNWKNQKHESEVYQKKISTHLFIVSCGVGLSIGLYLILTTFFKEAKKPLIDSFTTVFSLIATYLTTKKWIANWIYWIVIDVVSTYLYFSRGLEIYALLMLAYSFIALYGYWEWKKLNVIKVD